jgi:hypothetical protein
MDIQSVPKVGISSVVHSKHIDADNIDVVDNDIALFDTESVISLYNGPTKLEVLTVGLCLEGTGTFKISLREFQLWLAVLMLKKAFSSFRVMFTLTQSLHGRSAVTHSSASFQE